MHHSSRTLTLQTDYLWTIIKHGQTPLETQYLIRCGLSPLLKENLAFKYSGRNCTLAIFFSRAVSTAVWAAFLASDVTVTFTSPAAARSSSTLFFALFSLANRLSSMAATFTPARSTFVEVAITYFWFTRRRGTPLVLYGPKKYIYITMLRDFKCKEK